VVYALLQRKNKETYIELLTALKDKFEALSIISTDFEHSVVLAMKQVFNNEVSVQLCFYHLSQYIWRKVQELGLAIRYEQDKKFREAVKMIPVLAFLPANIVKKSYFLFFICINLCSL